MKGMKLVLVAAVMMAASQNLWAVTLDLTTLNTSGTINGGIFSTNDLQAAGSGVIHSFVRINPGGGADYEQGYNTDGRPLQYDENSSPTFTRSLAIGEVPIVSIGGLLYREFLLDINQVNSDPLLTLNRVVISLRSAGDLLGGTVAPGSSLGAGSSLFTDDTVVYDSLAGNRVLLNYSLQEGSGTADMFLYVPNFDGPPGFVYLYSEFGLEGNPQCPNGNVNNCFAEANDGFEEWSVRTPTPPTSVPEPTSLVLLGIGLVGLAANRARRSRM